MFGTRVVADNSAAAPALQGIGMPIMHFIPNCGFREKDSAIWSNIEVVGQAQSTVIDYR